VLENSPYANQLVSAEEQELVLEINQLREQIQNNHQIFKDLQKKIKAQILILGGYENSIKIKDQELQALQIELSNLQPGTPSPEQLQKEARIHELRTQILNETEQTPSLEAELHRLSQETSKITKRNTNFQKQLEKKIEETQKHYNKMERESCERKEQLRQLNDQDKPEELRAQLDQWKKQLEDVSCQKEERNKEIKEWQQETERKNRKDRTHPQKAPRWGIFQLLLITILFTVRVIQNVRSFSTIPQIETSSLIPTNSPSLNPFATASLETNLYTQAEVTSTAIPGSSIQQSNSATKNNRSKDIFVEFFAGVKKLRNAGYKFNDQENRYLSYMEDLQSIWNELIFNKFSLSQKALLEYFLNQYINIGLNFSPVMYAKQSSYKKTAFLIIIELILSPLSDSVTETHMKKLMNFYSKLDGSQEDSELVLLALTSRANSLQLNFDKLSKNNLSPIEYVKAAHTAIKATKMLKSFASSIHANNYLKKLS
jgi:hypothetical protein